MALLLHGYAGWQVPHGTVVSPDNIYGGVTGSPTSNGGTATLPCDAASSLAVLQRLSDGGAAKTVRWYVQNAVNQSGIGGLAEGDEFIICVVTTSAGGSPGLQIYGKKSGAGYKILLYIDAIGHPQIGSTGSTVFSVATAYHMRLQTDGSNIELYFGGTLEVSAASAYNIRIANGFGAMLSGSTLFSAGTTRTFGPSAIFSGDTTADRPADHVTVQPLITNNNAPHHTGFANVTPGGTNKDDDIDDWETGTVDDATTFNSQAGLANTTYVQSYRVNTLTIPASETIYGCQIWSRYRDSADPKTDTISIFECDGTSETYVTVADPDTAWLSGAPYLFTKDPAGAAWGTSMPASFQFGMRSVTGGSIVVFDVTAEYGEVLSCLADPPAATARNWGFVIT